jgi:hypothetical protein
MTTPTGIDRNAPVIAHHEIDIAAPLEAVWDLHTDVDAWPSWNQEMTAAKLDGAFAPGGSFTWTSYGFIMGVHEWRFEPTPGGVQVITTESFAGDPVDTDPAGLQATLDNSLTAWLTRLKQKAESSAGND